MLFASLQYLRFYFEDIDLESHTSCQWDSVQIHQQGRDRPLAVTCGNNCRPDVIVPASSAYVTFISDYSVTGNGFRLRYAVVDTGNELTRISMGILSLLLILSRRPKVYITKKISPSLPKPLLNFMDGLAELLFLDKIGHRWFRHRRWPGDTDPDSKVHGANIGPIWGRLDPDGPHVGPMNFAIWGASFTVLFELKRPFH